VKDIILRRKGLKGQALKTSQEQLLEVLEQSISLLSINLKEQSNSLAEVDKDDPFSHNDKLKGVYKIATKLQLNNDKKLQAAQRAKEEKERLRKERERKRKKEKADGTFMTQVKDKSQRGSSKGSNSSKGKSKKSERSRSKKTQVHRH
jgi:hypothetical protein